MTSARWLPLAVLALATRPGQHGERAELSEAKLLAELKSMHAQAEADLVKMGGSAHGRHAHSKHAPASLLDVGSAYVEPLRLSERAKKFGEPGYMGPTSEGLRKQLEALEIIEKSYKERAQERSHTDFSHPEHKKYTHEELAAAAHRIEAGQFDVDHPTRVSEFISTSLADMPHVPDAQSKESFLQTVQSKAFYSDRTHGPAQIPAALAALGLHTGARAPEIRAKYRAEAAPLRQQLQQQPGGAVQGQLKTLDHAYDVLKYNLYGLAQPKGSLAQTDLRAHMRVGDGATFDGGAETPSPKSGDDEDDIGSVNGEGDADNAEGGEDSAPADAGIPNKDEAGDEVREEEEQPQDEQLEEEENGLADP